MYMKTPEAMGCGQARRGALYLISHSSGFQGHPEIIRQCRHKPWVETYAGDHGDSEEAEGPALG